MKLRPRRFYAGLAVPVSLATVAMLSAAPGATAAPGVAASSAATFKNFEPAGLKSRFLYTGGGSVGTTCPNADPSKCYNLAGEPAIRADGDGTFYASSENGLGAGTEAWKSTSNGRTYETLPSPNAGSMTNDSGFAPGGGDTDLAVDDDKNANGFYNVYVASLSLAEIDVSTSTDGGKTFKLNPVGALVPGDDREWIAADDSHQSPLGLPLEDGPKVCVSYHDLTTSNIDVNCSYDAGRTFTQLGDAIDATHAFTIDNNMIGNLAIARDTVEGDHTRGNHNIYQVFSGPADPAGTTACGTASTCLNTVYIGVSKDGGQTFTDHVVYKNPDIKVSYGHQFVNVSVDRKGNIYVIYSDNHNLFYSYSTDQGTTWSAPFRLNKTPSNTAIEPWSVAGNDGALDVVWYGTSATGNPETLPNTAAWHVYFAQSLNATSTSPTFSQVAASPVNHHGGVCEGGVTCTGNRDLLDDFGVAASPTTGLASIVYTDDQFRASDPNNPNSPICTAARTDTGNCEHTAFATQLTGGRIYP